MTIKTLKSIPTTDTKFVILCEDEEGIFSYTARNIDGELELFMPESDSWFVSDIESFTDCTILGYVVKEEA